MGKKVCLVIGIVLSSIIYGLLIVVDKGDDVARALGVVAWLVLIVLCVVSSLRMSKVSRDSTIIIRLIVALCVNAFFFWTTPWDGLSILGMFAGGYIGAMILLYVYSLLSVFCMSLLLVFTLFLVAGYFEWPKAKQIIRWILLLSVVSLIYMILGILSMWLHDVAAGNSEWLYRFVSGFTTMGSVGIAFYFITISVSNVLNSKESMSSGNVPTVKSGSRFLIALVVLFVGLLFLDWLASYLLLPIITILQLPFLLVAGVIAVFSINGLFQGSLKSILLPAFLFGAILLIASFALEVFAPFIYYASGSILLLEVGVRLLNSALFVSLFLVSVKLIIRSIDEVEGMVFGGRQILIIVIASMLVIALPIVENLISTSGYVGSGELTSLLPFGFVSLLFWGLLSGACVWGCSKGISSR